MGRPMRTSGVLLASMLLILDGCGPPSDGFSTPSGSSGRAAVTLDDGSAALAWGDGPYGLVLVHGAAYGADSWDPQARVFADHGMTVVAVERTEATTLLAALRYLTEERDLERVALVGASAGTAAVLVVGRDHPELVDQLIIVSGSGDVHLLGDFPKLFAASEGEAAAAAAERMASEAPGAWNELYLAPGSAHAQAIFESDAGGQLLEVLVARLDERR